MKKGIVCKLYLERKQQEVVEKMFDDNRFVWNTVLNMLTERYTNNKNSKILGEFQLNYLLPALKKEYLWLKDLDSQALKQTNKKLSVSFTRFFKGTSNYPRFKSKKESHQSYTTTYNKNNIRFNDTLTYLKVPKIGWIKCKPGNTKFNDIKSVTIARNSSGHYTGTLLVTGENQTLTKTDKQVGIDLGITDLAILSDGTRYKSRKLHLEYKKKLHYWEKRMARRRLLAKKKGIPLEEAKNYQKARQQVAKIHEKISNIRKDYIHKITTEIIQTYDLVALEDLKTSNMMRNHKLARSIANQSWRMFRTFLEYKSDWYGKELKIVNPYKTSQICSNCSYDDGKHTLDIREWECPKCNTTHDRDINASKNILKLGLGKAIVK